MSVASMYWHPLVHVFHIPPTQPQYICNVELFLRGLTDHLHARRPGSLVIWYDSITQNGQLHWQNQLNQQNM